LDLTYGTSTSERDDVTAALATTPLTAADRCDRCGAQAYVRVRLSSGGELLFCAHHGREHTPRLQEAAADIHDESHRLAGAPAPAADQER
jgi:hypothetical protein